MQKKQTTSEKPVILWLRNDLRLTDNAALTEAAKCGQPLIVLYIYSPEDEGRWPRGAASRWWLHHSLTELQSRYQELGANLIIQRGPVAGTLTKVIEETGASAVYWNRRYEPAERLLEQNLKGLLKTRSVAAFDYNSSLIVEPSSLMNGQGTPYLVFTPFWNSVRKLPVRPPLGAVRKLNPAPLESLPASLSLVDLELLPRINWDSGMREFWRPGEKGGLKRLNHFIDTAIGNYPKGRDRPDWDGVSCMSPYLHFGEVSPHTIWHTVMRHVASDSRLQTGAESYLREVVWREFAHYLLYHFSDTAEQPLRKQFLGFPWRKDDDKLQRWQSGQTGYPMVDAGMRQLWKTGWMHNRVRMIVASFLVKDLLIPWQAGAEWFWDTLVDADLANNTLGWQWTAGCGADAAPYFRIFNPITQGEKFDPSGIYVRQWVPEISKLPDRWIHRPWEAPPLELASRGITLGETYPLPIVDHSDARRLALAAFQTIRADNA